MEKLTIFLGWSTLINLIFLSLVALILMVAKEKIVYLHKKWFDLSPGELDKLYFQYMANYKVLIIVFNLVPYLVLRLVMI